MKVYHAIIWGSDPNSPGKRVSVVAETLEEAKAKLEAEHGKGDAYDLHSEEEAARPH